LGAEANFFRRKTVMVEEERYQAYLDERRLLVDGEVQVAGRFDTSVLTLSGGALLLSMTFIKDIVHGSPKGTWSLLVAWVLLGTAIGVMLVSLLTSQKAYRKQRDILDEELDKPNKQAKYNSWACATKWLNRMSIALFLVGVVFLGCFTIRNIQGSLGEEDGKEKRSSTTQTSETSARAGYAEGSSTTETAEASPTKGEKQIGRLGKRISSKSGKDTY